MDKPYVLQHKDKAVAVLMVDDAGEITDISDTADPKYLPVLCSMGISLKTWWSRRSIPANRKGIKEDLLDKRIASPRQLLIQNLGLSLTDCYWLRPLDSPYLWSDVNLFENPFRDMIISIHSSGSETDLQDVSPFVPSSSLQGELKKKWIIIDGKRVLIKGNYGDSMQQSVNEVFASLLHQKQGGFPYTNYWLTTLNTPMGETLGCACENFCNIHTEFVSAYEIAYSYKKKNDQSEYESYINYADAHGIDIRRHMEYQIASDFILTNTDRHFNNFGLLRDSDSLEYLGPAPIFDTGNCLFFRDSVPGGKALYDIPVTSFRKRETDLLRYITDYHVLDTRLLPSEDELYRLLLKDTKMLEEKRIAVCHAYKAKIQMYADCADGKKIWDYQYRK